MRWARYYCGAIVNIIQIVWPSMMMPPACITAKGNLHILNQPIIVIVGARNASINARHHAQKMATELGQNGYIIVSGMARGIDTAAHRGALPTGIIGVVARGINMICPSENADLFDQVAATGLLLAEMHPARTRHRAIFQFVTG